MPGDKKIYLKNVPSANLKIDSQNREVVKVEKEQNENLQSIKDATLTQTQKFNALLRANKEISKLAKGSMRVAVISIITAVAIGAISIYIANIAKENNYLWRQSHERYNQKILEEIIQMNKLLERNFNEMKNFSSKQIIEK